RLDMDRMEGSLDKPISQVVEMLPFFFLIFIFLIFSFRLYDLQINNFSTYKEKADDNRYNEKLILADR
ncbi:MAG: hypothetical protein RI945_295, partial [Candidatus Parcubacteria bacterium]